MNFLLRNSRRTFSVGKTLLRPEVLKEITNPDGRIVQKLDKPIQVELMEKLEMGCDNSFVYRFALPGRESVLGHKTC